MTALIIILGYIGIVLPLLVAVGTIIGEMAEKQETEMIDYASKEHIKGVSSERIRPGFMDLKRKKARELLAVILTDDWRYVRSECTDIRKTFARNTGLPS